MRHPCAALLLAVAVLAAPRARAQTPRDDGARLISQGEFNAALQILLPAFAEDPDGPLAYLTARAFDGLRETALAVRFYGFALRLPGTAKQFREHSRARLRELGSGAPAPPAGGVGSTTLHVTAPVAGATVYVDGRKVGMTPLAGVPIAPGKRLVEVKHPTYGAWSATVQVVRGTPVRLDARLRGPPGSVRIETVPPGATASVAQGPTCITPCLLSLAAGTYDLTVRLQGYETLATQFTKVAGRDVSLRFPLQGGGGGLTGTLHLEVDPTDAEVFLGETLVGRTPLGPLPVKAGAYILTVRKAGYRDATLRFTMSAGADVTRTLRLQRASSAFRPPGMDPPPSSDATRTYRIAGWTTLSIGIAAVGAAVGLTVHSVLNQQTLDEAARLRIEDQLYVSGITRARALELEDMSKTESIAAYVLYGVGAAALTTGIVLLIIDPPGMKRDPLSPPLTLAPMLGPSLVGAEATLRF